MEVAEVDTACNVKETPEFAVACSFIELFSEDLSISITHPQLLRCLQLTENDNIPKIWIDIHRKLLGKIKFSCSIEKWEMKLQKFIHNFCSRNLMIEFYIDFLNYSDLLPLDRVRVLNILFDSQFDRNSKFKEKVNVKGQKILRNVPFGGDIHGCIYWLFVDIEKNVLFYKENLEEETFKLIADSIDQLVTIKDDLQKVVVDEVDLSLLYKYPEDVDSPLAEYIHDLEQNKQKSPEEAVLAMISDRSIKDEPTNISKVINGNSVILKEKIIDEKQDIEIDNECSNIDIKSSENLEVKMEESIDAKENKSVEMIDLNKVIEENEIIPKESMEIIESQITKIVTNTKNESIVKEEIVKMDVEEISEKVSNDKCDEQQLEVTNVIKSKKNHKSQLTLEEIPSSELRRSSRQRKPVTLFTIEHSSRTGDLSQVLSSDESDSQKSKRKKKNNKKKDSVKSTPVKNKSEVKTDKNNHKKEKSLSKKKKKHKGIGKKNNKIKKRKPWETGDDESDNEQVQSCVEEYDEQEESEEIELEDPWANDQPESDFDLDKLECGSDDEVDKARGRNYYLQKKRQKQKKEDEDITICQICLSSQLPEMLLLCDQCDNGHHAMCLRPPLMIVPEGEWYCPKCCHKKLLARLTEIIPDLTEAKAALQAKSRMQERLNFVNISMSNILSVGPKKTKSYNADGNEEENDDDDEDADGSSNSSDDDGSTDESSDGSDQRPYEFRESSRKEAHKYNFEELDKMYYDALVYDEKYQWKKKHQTQIEGGENDDENVEEDEDGDDEEDGSNKKKGSDSEYDYSEIVPRKKSGGKDMSNLLPESEEEEEQGDRPKIRRGNYNAPGKKRRLNSFSTSEEENNGEDAKDADFRLSEVDEDDDEFDKVQYDVEEEDESDDWLGSRRKSSRQRNSRRLTSRTKSKHGRRKRKGRNLGVRTTSSRNSTLLNRNQRSKLKAEVVKDRYETRPRRSAARKVNYRELIGEGDDYDDDDGANELYEEEVDVDEKPGNEPAKKFRLSKEQEESDLGSKSPDFDDDSDSDGGNKNACANDDKPPPVVKRVPKSTRSYSVKKKLESDSEYEQSAGGFSSEEDEEEEEEVRSVDDEDDGEEEAEQDDDTDRQQEEDEEDAVAEPPLKKQRVDSPALKMTNGEDKETGNEMEKNTEEVMIPDESNSKFEISNKIIPQIHNEANKKSPPADHVNSLNNDNPLDEPMKIASPIPPPQPIKLIKELEPISSNVINIKNPMRADDSQDEDCEDDVDSESEFVMTSVKR